jgi:hypothetical protein
MEEMEYSRDQEIADTQVSRPHVVILGAGASRAAFPNGDRNGAMPPLMNDLVDVCGLAGPLSSAGLDNSCNFEEIYSELREAGNHSLVSYVDDVIEQYFCSLRLPDHPTIYDALVLSLRPKDLVATFNWDPFLYQACARNHKAAALPMCAYLHGNVAVGYCLADRRKGMRGDKCSVCGTAFTTSPLLYPVKTKGYSDDPFISVEWKTLRSSLKNAFMLTVFGYGAPESDVEAIELMSDAWGSVDSREFEQTELIDILDEEALRANWARFIHTHHYDIRRDFFDSWIAQHPRRTCEAAWQQFFEAKFISNNKVPLTSTLPELWSWYQPLLDVETAHGLSSV